MTNERESSNSTVVTLLNQKIDQLIEVVTEIKDNLTTIKDDVRDLQLDMRDVQNINKQQQKEIDEQKQASKSNKAWLMGIASGLIVTAVGALFKAFMGV
jgi:predicted  nucleic acid-binding Zn-ribbon protein